MGVNNNVRQTGRWATTTAGARRSVVFKHLIWRRAGVRSQGRRRSEDGSENGQNGLRDVGQGSMLGFIQTRACPRGLMHRQQMQSKASSNQRRPWASGEGLRCASMLVWNRPSRPGAFSSHKRSWTSAAGGYPELPERRSLAQACSRCRKQEQAPVLGHRSPSESCATRVTVFGAGKRRGDQTGPRAQKPAPERGGSENGRAGEVGGIPVGRWPACVTWQAAFWRRAVVVLCYCAALCSMVTSDEGEGLETEHPRAAVGLGRETLASESWSTMCEGCFSHLQSGDEGHGAPSGKQSLLAAGEGDEGGGGERCGRPVACSWVHRPRYARGIRPHVLLSCHPAIPGVVGFERVGGQVEGQNPTSNGGVGLAASRQQAGPSASALSGPLPCITQVY